MRKDVSKKFFEMMRGNLLSRVSGFVREVVVASFFGASRATDIFAIAFTIPTLFRRILGEDMVEKAFLPTFRQLVAAGEYRRAWVLASKIFTIMVFCLALCTGLLYLFTPELIKIIGAGLKETAFRQAVLMTYIILPFMVLIGMASFVGGLLLFMDATDIYGFAPVMLSIGVIGGVVVLTRYIGIYALAVGFVVGGFLQLIFQIPFLIKNSRKLHGGLTFRLRRQEKMPEMKTVGQQSGWIFLQSMSSKTVEVVDRMLASYLVAGSVAALYFAQRLIQLPNAILSLALSRAYVTDLNDQAQRKDWSGFRTTVIQSLEASLALMIPVMALMVGLSQPITALVFKRGSFGIDSVAKTSLAFTFYSLGLLGIAIYNNYSRIFPALNKNQWPVLTSILAAIVNVVLNLILVRTPLAHGGIALASSLAFTLNALLLFIILNYELKQLGVGSITFNDIKRVFWPVSVGALSGGLVVNFAYRNWQHLSGNLFSSWQLFFDWQSLLGLIISIPLGGLVFFLVLGYWGRFRAEPGKRILLTGGGTGGHVNPALAIAEAIKKREPGVEFLYVGVRGKAESVIVGRAGYPIEYIKAVAYPGFVPSLKLCRFLLVLFIGMAKSFWILANYQPRWIVGTGGYVSAPIIFTHTLMRFLGMSRAKVFIHEQNSVPGKLNALVGRFADRVFLTFPQTLNFFPKNGVVVGYPVRESVKVIAQEEALKKLPFKVPQGAKVVFVFGGSQGARTINRAIIDALGDFLAWEEKIFIIHGMGILRSSEYDAVKDTKKRLTEKYTDEELAEIEKFYYAQDYFHNIGYIYAISDLIVCRSGAGSLNEISMVGKPALVIPKANLPGDHQVMNARAMKRARAAEVIFEDTVIENGQILEKVQGHLLAKRIKEVVTDGDKLKELSQKSSVFFRKDALSCITSELYGDTVREKGLTVKIQSWESEKVQPISSCTGPPARRASGSERVATEHLFQPCWFREEDKSFEPLFSNTELLHKLNTVYSTKAPGDTYHPLDVIRDPDDLEYYRHRAAALFTSPDWRRRNIGVKLIGLLKCQDKIPTLLHMLEDKTPVGPLKRFLGGDYQEVGFIRRNVLTAIRTIGYWDETIETSVLGAFSDQYYEVVANTARTGEYFSSRLHWPRKWQEELIKKLDDKHLEVVIASAKALGAVGINDIALKHLMLLGGHMNWQVRDAALQGIKVLLKRQVIAPDEELNEKLAQFILTSTDFRPFFSIKESYRNVRDEIDRHDKTKT